MKDLRAGQIYLLRNLKNGKGYVGMSLNAEARWARHIKSAARGSKNLVHRAMRKHGVENFSAEVIHTCTEALLPHAERCFISKFKTHVSVGGYNVAYGGDGGPMPKCVCKKLTNGNVRRYSNQANRTISSERAKALWKQPAYREKQLQLIQTGLRKPEVRAKLSVGARRQFEDLEQRRQAAERASYSWSASRKLAHSERMKQWHKEREVLIG